jgi:hypothetical protein
MHERELLDSLIAEYEGILQNIEQEGNGRKAEIESLAKALEESGDWTQQGAAQIIELVTCYGAFMLRNALALAVALGREDGDLGF